MTAYVKRTQQIKKQEQLHAKKQVLVNSIVNNLDPDIIYKKAEKYKEAFLLYNKALLHLIREFEWQKKKHNYNKEKISEDISIWQIKDVQEIINEIKNEQK